MKKLFASLFAVSSVTFAVAPVQAQATSCPFGQALYNGSCFPYDPAPTDEFTLQAEGEVVHECNLVGSTNFALTRDADSTTGEAVMQGSTQIDFTQSSNTVWEITSLNVNSPFGTQQAGSIFIEPPEGRGAGFGRGVYANGLTPSRRNYTSVGNSGGTFTVTATALGTPEGTLLPGTYGVTSTLTCYSTGLTAGEN